MVIASQLRPGMVVRHEGHTFRVVSCEYHAGQGKMSGVAHVRLKNLLTGTFLEHGFRAEIKLEVIDVEKQNLEFLYSDPDHYFFMNPENFEQIGISQSVIGAIGRFLQPQMRLPVEFAEGNPINVVFPDIVELRIKQTAPPAHQQQDNTWKQAELENGLEIMVPQFIRTGDTIRVDVEKLKYMDRAKGASR
jgi:elongation factor P